MTPARSPFAAMAAILTARPAPKRSTGGNQRRQREAIKVAARLLRRHGWTVVPPGRGS